MILRHPIARVVVDGRSFSSAEAAVAGVEVRLALGGAHDSARVSFWTASKVAGVVPDARVSVALGEKSGMVEVWAGKVSHVQLAEGQLSFEALSYTEQLSRQRVSRTYQDQHVEDIVRDLAGEVDIDEVDASLQLPWYAVDTRRSIWSHLRELAQLIGADVSANPSGAVRYVPSSAGGEAHDLRYGAELLRWELGEQAPSTPRGVRAYGAASEAGAKQWHWLLGDSGQTGGGTITGAIRTKDAADLVERARTDRSARRTHQGVVLAVGTPGIRPGDVVRLKDVPNASSDRYRTTAVTHRLDARRGFTTSLRLEGVNE